MKSAIVFSAPPDILLPSLLVMHEISCPVLSLCHAVGLLLSNNVAFFFVFSQEIFLLWHLQGDNTWWRQHPKSFSLG